MDLEFTPDQEELRTSVRAVLGRECPPSLVRELVEKGTQADDLWTAMVELDWPALTIDTAHGGLGLGFVELAVVVEELGRAITPGPFLPTVTQFVPAIREAGTPAWSSTTCTSTPTAPWASRVDSRRRSHGRSKRRRRPWPWRWSEPARRSSTSPSSTPRPASSSAHPSARSRP